MHAHRHLSHFFPIAPLSFALLAACGASEDSGKSEPSEIDLAWTAYDIAPPADDVQTLLGETPFLWPEQVCTPVDMLPPLPEGTETVIGDDGQEMVCVWDAFSGNVPEGLQFTDMSTCAAPFTQGPPWFTKPGRAYESDDALLEDADWVAEADWARGQIEASGCSCCHASGVGSGFTSGFDANAPGVWTDSMTNARLAMAAGMFDEHSLFGHFEADVNHGFDRTHTLFASTDPDRLAAFFTAEFERRDGSQEDLDIAAGQFEALFGRLFREPVACIDPYEGVVDGTLVWNGAGVRQVYILETDANTPGFPPNLDRPEGTVWAVYVTPDARPLESGTVTPGEIPAGTQQMVPADGSAPVLTAGRTYRLYATPDVMIPSELDCLFTF